MTIDWVTIGISIASALLTAIVHSAATSSAPSATPAPSTTGNGLLGLGIFRGGLLNRLKSSASTPAQAPTPASPTVAPVATSHPVISSLLSILESEISSTQGQQLLSQLSGAVLTLTGTNGTQTSVSAGSQTITTGGSSNASGTLSSAASAAAGS